MPRNQAASFASKKATAVQPLATRWSQREKGLAKGSERD